MRSGVVCRPSVSNDPRRTQKLLLTVTLQSEISECRRPHCCNDLLAGWTRGLCGATGTRLFTATRRTRHDTDKLADCKRIDLLTKAMCSVPRVTPARLQRGSRATPHHLHSETEATCSRTVLGFSQHKAIGIDSRLDVNSALTRTNRLSRSDAN